MTSSTAAQPSTGPPLDQQQAATINTPFPNPPSFWTSFISANVSAYQALEAKAAAGALPTPLELPPELVNLRPPTPPASGEYHSFGEGRSLAAPLTPLPPETVSLLPSDLPQPTPQHLLNLTRSLILSYLELLYVLATDPSPPIYGPKWEDLRDLFRNAYHGLNSYRPWQAREALIGVLEETARKAKEEIQGVKDLEGKVDTVLGDLSRTLAGEGDAMDLDVDEGGGVNGVRGGELNGDREVNSEVEDLERERMIWDILREELEE